MSEELDLEEERLFAYLARPPRPDEYQSPPTVAQTIVDAYVMPTTILRLVEEGVLELGEGDGLEKVLMLVRPEGDV
jgi:hypothetical protein